MVKTPAKKAPAPPPPPKPPAADTHKGQAVANFMLPIAASWLLAVAGLLAWNDSGSALLGKVGKVAVAAAAATALLTVILAAIQDALPARFKQRLLFLRWNNANPSFRAFEAAMLKKAERELPANLAHLPGHPARQNAEWQKAYERNRAHVAVAHLAQRTIAWRDTVPLLFLLTAGTVGLAWALGCPRPVEGWMILTAACAIMLLVCWSAAVQAATGLVVTVVRLLADEPPAAAPAPPPPPAPKPAKKAGG